MKKVKEGYTIQKRGLRATTNKATRSAGSANFAKGSATEESMRTSLRPSKRIPQMLVDRNEKGIRNRA